jgi:hypothetical protein
MAFFVRKTENGINGAMRSGRAASFFASDPLFIKGNVMFPLFPRYRGAYFIFRRTL